MNRARLRIGLEFSGVTFVTAMVLAGCSPRPSGDLVAAAHAKPPSSGNPASPAKTVSPSIPALIDAVNLGDADAVAAMLKESPAFANALTEYDGTILHLASRQQTYAADPELETKRRNWVTIVRLLLAAGADPRARGGSQVTPLHVAGSADVASALLAAGAEVGAVDEFGQTPLILAVASRDPAIVSVLLDHKAGIDHRDQDGLSAIDHAARDLRVEVVRLLHERGAAGGAFYVAALSGDRIAVERILTTTPGPSARAMVTAFFLAVQSSHDEVVRVLLDAGVDANSADAAGRFALGLAASQGDVPLATLLLDRGARVNPESDGYLAFRDNPLRSAVIGGHVPMIELLLSRGARTLDEHRFASEEGYNPTLAESALTQGLTEIVSLLLEKCHPDDRAGLLGHDAALSAVRSGKPAMVDFVRAQGIDPADSQAMLAAIEQGDTAMMTHLATLGFESTPDGALHAAVRSGKTEMVDLVLAHGVDVSQQDFSGETAFAVAVGRSDRSMADHLLGRGATVNPASPHDVGPLHQAAGRGDRAMVEFLLERGADVSRVDVGGGTALDAALETNWPEVIDLLIARGGRPARRHPERLLAAVTTGNLAATQVFLHPAPGTFRIDDEHGRTLLHLAADKGSEVIVRALLEAGCPVDEVDGDGCTALHRAGSPGVVEVLLAGGADINAPERSGYTALHLARTPGIAAVLAARGADTGRVNVDGLTPLSEHALAGRVAIMQVLLQHGADIDQRVGDQQLSALDHAVRAGAREAVDFLCAQNAAGAGVVRAMQSGDVAAVRRLFANTPPPHEATATTALFIASRLGRADLAEIALAARADPNARDRTGRFPIHLAIASGKTDVVEVLLKSGAGAGVVDDETGTPLRVAALRQDRAMIELLLAHWADIDRPHWPEDGPLGGVTLLEEAIDRGDAGFVEFLLTHGASPRADSLNGGVTIMRAVRAGHAEIVTLLAEHGADVRGAFDGGASPLDVAVDAGHVDVVEALLVHGASANEVDADGRRPYDRAEAAGNAAMAEVLNRHGAFGAAAIEAVFGAITRKGTAEEILLLPNRVRDFLRAHPDMINLRHNGETPLTAAVLSGNAFMMAEILECGPDPNLVSAKGFTPLVLIASAGQDAGLRKLSEVLANALLKLGADVNAVMGERKLTALWFAVDLGDAELVDFLLKHGASARAVDADGYTLIEHLLDKGDEPALVQRLVTAGAPVNATRFDRMPPLAHAVWRKRVESVKVLLKAGANPNVTVRIANADDSAMSLLVYAILERNAAIVDALIEGKVDVHHRDATGGRPLLWAASAGNVEIVRRLIGAGAVVSATGKNGGTPLHFAAGRGRVEVVRVLLEAGAAVNARADDGSTPLDLAESYEVSDVLQSRGGRRGSDL